MEITSEMIKRLRDKTGAGMMDCKRALEASNGEMDQAIERQADRRLESDDAFGSEIEFEHLFVGMVRRVVCRDRVNRAVTQPFDDGLEIVPRTQRRRHFCVRVVVAEIDFGVGQSEVMGRDFAGHG